MFLFFLAEYLLDPRAMVVLEVDDWLEDVWLGVAVGGIVAAVVANPVLFSLVLAAFANGETVFQPCITVYACFLLLLYGNWGQSHCFRHATKPVS